MTRLIELDYEHRLVALEALNYENQPFTARDALRPLAKLTNRNVYDFKCNSPEYRKATRILENLRKLGILEKNGLGPYKLSKEFISRVILNESS